MSEPARRLLIVDDDPALQFVLCDYFETKGFTAAAAGSCREALEAVRGATFDLALIDHNLPDGDGVSLLRQLRAQAPDLAVVMLTAVSAVEIAVTAVREGAAHFITKPIDLPALQVLLDRTLADSRNARVSAAVDARRAVGEPFAGESERVRQLARMAARAAAASNPVLLLGETGSGKGVLARWLHATGPRAAEAMVDLNCAGLSRELVESELFGHEKGAFTGAIASKPGLLEIAHRGTLFLDEVAELDLTVQAKLLKVLEDQRFRRVGSVQDRHVSVRVLAATSADIQALIAAGAFRRDLYFRLATLVLEVPPLRERKDEIPVLAAHILSQLSTRGPRVALSQRALHLLVEYSWPGNVRELRNVLERAALFADGPVIDHLLLQGQLTAGAPTAISEPAGARRMTLEEVERAHIEAVMAEVGGRVERASEWLGIPRSTLYEKLRRFGMATRRSS